MRTIATAGQSFFLSRTDGVSRGARFSTEGVEAFAEAAPAASKHWRVAQGETAGLRFSQFLKQIEKIRGFVRFKRNDELLIIEAKRIGRMQLYRTILGTDADILFQHFVPLLLRPGIPLTGAQQRTQKQIVGAAGNDVRAIFLVIRRAVLDEHRSLGHRKK